MSRVDVFIPCYNYGRFLRECVQSVLTQEGVEARVLILDDASKDDSEQVGRELAAQDGRVEYRRHAVNRGHIETYNEGIDWAAGDYTLLLSADDMLTPGALSRAAGVMDAHPHVGFIYGRAIKAAAPRPAEFVIPASPSWRIVSGAEWIKGCCAEGYNRVFTPTAVVRTELQKRIGGYRKELPHSGDLEMWLRFAAHADVGVVDADQAYYRIHGSNMSSHYLGVLDLRQRKEAFDSFFTGCGALIPDPARLKGLAMRSMAGHSFWAASRAFESGDRAACRDLLAFARDTDPSLNTGLIWRLRCKQFLGPRTWSVLRPLLHRLRRERRDAAVTIN